MTWLKVDDAMPEHPKIVGLAPATKWALMELWCYCARHRTNGKVPEGAVKRMASAKVLRELDQAGLIHRNGTGWLIHDWLDHNVSAEDAEAKRLADAERLRKWRERRRETDDETDGDT